jgi:acyl-coenzyme A synthetase/AMP-(fatty) acid ligase
LLTHPAVLQAAVIGVPIGSGAIGQACIVPAGMLHRRGQLIQHCRNLIASYEAAQHRLPRRAAAPVNGKIDKQQLRAVLEGRRARGRERRQSQDNLVPWILIKPWH